VDMTRTFDQLAAGDLIDLEEGETCAGRHDIGDGILRSDLVEADRLRWNSVNGSLRNGNALENSQGPLLHLGSKSALGEEFPDLCVIASVGMRVSVGMGMRVSMLMGVLVLRMVGMPVIVGMVIVVIMVMGVPLLLMVVMGCVASFLAIVTFHPEAPSRDAVSLLALKPASGQFYPECAQCVMKDRLGNTQVSKRGNGHVAADSGEGIDVKDSHGRAWCGLNRGLCEMHSS